MYKSNNNHASIYVFCKQLKLWPSTYTYKTSIKHLSVRNIFNDNVRFSTRDVFIPCTYIPARPLWSVKGQNWQLNSSCTSCCCRIRVFTYADFAWDERKNCRNQQFCGFTVPYFAYVLFIMEHGEQHVRFGRIS